MKMQMWGNMKFSVETISCHSPSSLLETQVLIALVIQVDHNLKFNSQRFVVHIFYDISIFPKTFLSDDISDVISYHISDHIF